MNKITFELTMDDNDVKDDSLICLNVNASETNNTLCSLTKLSSNGQNTEESAREPDSDALKMFVGQIPRDWNEDDCRRLLEPFGDVHAINLLKDKRTSKSKGCCFVTFYNRRAALEAQNALHNIKTLPSCHHPIQMKPADTENRNDIRSMFSAFGMIEECSLLKDGNGQSKGCAFVTFSSRSSASNAIKTLNHSTTMEGCTSSLVVKFADTQKDKETRKSNQSLMQHFWLQNISPLSTPLVANPYITLAALNAAQQQQQQQQQQHHHQQQQLAATLALQQQYLNSDILATAFATNPLLMAAALTGSPHTKVSAQSPVVSSLNQRYNSNKIDMLTGVRDQLGFSTSLQSTTTLQPTVQHVNAAANSKQLEGPEGANLFIYHLPPEFSDADLISTFTQFGNVISAKVFIDKNSNLSKCFGFVSYDNAVSAQSAISSMHGYQIRNKRLKVQLKKTRDKPY